MAEAAETNQSYGGTHLLRFACLLLAFTILGTVGWVYISYVPSIALVGFHNLALGEGLSGHHLSDNVVQWVLTGLGLVSVCGILAGAVYKMLTGRTSWSIVLAVALVSSVFFVFIGIGVFGQGQLIRAQKDAWRKFAAEAVAKAEQPPYPGILAGIEVESGRLATARSANTSGLHQQAVTAFGVCAAYGTAITDLRASTQRIADREAEGGIVGGSQKAGQGPVWRQFTRLTESARDVSSTQVGEAIQLVATPPLRLDEAGITALAKARSACPVLRTDLERRIGLLEDTVGAIASDAVFAKAKGHLTSQINGVATAARAALAVEAVFPTGGEEQLRLATALEGLGKLHTHTARLQEEYLKGVADMRQRLRAMDWSQPLDAIKPTFFSLLEDVNAGLSNFNTLERPQLDGLLRIVPDANIRHNISGVWESYTTKSVAPPQDLTMFQVWFDGSNYGLWLFAVALSMSLAVETLALWGSMLIIGVLSGTIRDLSRDLAQMKGITTREERIANRVAEDLRRKYPVLA